MTTFYKAIFKPFFEKWKAQKKNNATSVLLVIKDFVKTTFAGLAERLTENQQIEFYELIKLLVFSHRHNKNDSYLENPIVDFSIV